MILNQNFIQLTSLFIGILFGDIVEFLTRRLIRLRTAKPAEKRRPLRVNVIVDQHRQQEVNQQAKDNVTRKNRQYHKDDPNQRRIDAKVFSNPAQYPGQNPVGRPL